MHTPSALLKKAIEICIYYHAEAVDRDGMPRIFHSFRVAAHQPTYQRICIALLHDVIEDAESEAEARWTVQEAFAEHPEIISAVECLTRGKTETWNAYYKRVRANQDACWVKLADIEDNFSPRRVDLKIAKKYHSYLEEYESICQILGIERRLALNYPNKR